MFTCIAKRIPVAALALLLAHSSLATVATYRLTVTNDWTQATFPANYPADAHFSWLGGGTHDDSLTVWQTGGMSSPGMELMAETGFTTLLADEIDAAGGTSIQFQHWFCPAGTAHASCGDLAVEFSIDSEQPLVTLVSMLGPSPDWFVGTRGRPLLRPDGAWHSTSILALNLYDAGTEEGHIPLIDFPASVPQEPIHLLGYDPVQGVYSPLVSGQFLEFFGSFTFELLDVVGDTDGDGIDDVNDNCIVVANADQRDTDADGYGNICDADLNNDGIVGTIDLGLFKLTFFSVGDLNADFDGDGIVNALDLGIFKLSFFLPPGPSGVDINRARR